MKQVVIKINTENSAFGDEPYEEISRILAVLAEKMQESYSVGSGSLRDINGNTVGTINIY